MKKNFFFLPVIIGLVFFVASQEIRLRRLTDAKDAQRAGMVIPSLEAQKLAQPLPAPGEPGPVVEKTSGPGSPGRASPQKMDGADISIQEGIIKERLLKIRQRVEARLLTWKEVLNLSDAQEIQLRAAMEAGEQKLEKLTRIKPEKGAPFQAYLEEGAALHTAQEEEIKSLLSEEQRAALERQKDSERQTQAEVHAGKQLATLQDNLILSGEQKDAAFQMYAQQALAFDPVRIIREGGDPAAAMEQLRQAAKEQLQQILTPDQYKLHIGQEEERAALGRQRGF